MRATMEFASCTASIPDGPIIEAKEQYTANPTQHDAISIRFIMTIYGTIRACLYPLIDVLESCGIFKEANF